MDQANSQQCLLNEGMFYLIVPWHSTMVRKSFERANVFPKFSRYYLEDHRLGTKNERMIDKE